MDDGRRRVATHTFLLRLVKRSVQEFLEDAGPHLAGSVAFRVLFSIFPLAIVLTAVFGIVLQLTGLQADVVDSIVSNVPLSEDGKNELARLLEGATGDLSGLGLAALVGLVWAASGMMAALRDGLNRAWNVESPRPLLRGKAVDVALVFATTLLVVLSLSIAVGTRLVQRYASADTGGLPTGVLAWVPGLAGPFLLAFVTVLFLYRVVPAQPPRLLDLWPAVTFVALVFALLQNLYAAYLEHFSNYNAVYGSLGAIIAFLLFVYVATSVFLLGAEAAAHWQRVREELEREQADSSGEGAEVGLRLGAALRGLLFRSRPHAARVGGRRERGSRKCRRAGKT